MARRQSVVAAQQPSGGSVFSSDCTFSKIWDMKAEDVSQCASPFPSVPHYMRNRKPVRIPPTRAGFLEAQAHGCLYLRPKIATLENLCVGQMLNNMTRSQRQNGTAIRA